MAGASGWPRAARVASGGVALAGLAGLVSPWLARTLAAGDGILEWAVDLAAHWQWLFLAVVAVAAMLLAVLGRRRWLLLLVATPLPWLTAAPALAPASPSGTAQAGTAGPQPGEAAFAIASANVFYRNPDPAPLRAWIDDVRPDVVAIVEIDHRFARALDTPAWADYPHRHVDAAAHAFGIAVLSRHPILAATVWRDEEGVGVLLARIRWGGRPLSLAVFHPVPPQDVQHHRARNRVLDCLTAEFADAAAGGRDALALVAGDFNATPWSNAFAGPSRRGWRRATGLAPTWPAAWRGLMGIPIDHVLGSSAWRAMDTQVGPAIGSDHRPVLARLQPEVAAAVHGSPLQPSRQVAAGPQGDPFEAVTSCLSRAPASPRPGA